MEYQRNACLQQQQLPLHLLELNNSEKKNINFNFMALIRIFSKKKFEYPLIRLLNLLLCNLAKGLLAKNLNKYFSCKFERAFILKMLTIITIKIINSQSFAVSKNYQT